MAGINVNGEQLEKGAVNINLARRRIYNKIGVNFVTPKDNNAMKNQEIIKLMNELDKLRIKSKKIENIFYDVFQMPHIDNPTSTNDFLKYFKETEKQNDWLQFLNILSNKQFIKNITTQAGKRYNTYIARVITNTKEKSKITKDKDFYTILDPVYISLKKSEEEKARSTYLQIVSRAKKKNFLSEDKTFRDSALKFFSEIINNQLSAMNDDNKGRYESALISKGIGNKDESSGKYILNNNFIKDLENNILEQQENVIKSLAKKNGLQDSVKIYDLKDSLDNSIFSVTLKQSAILEVTFETKIENLDSIATVSDIRNIGKNTYSSEQEALNELTKTIIKVIYDNLQNFYKGNNINNFYNNTINNDKFQTKLSNVIETDFKNKNKTIGGYIKSMFGSEPGEAPSDQNSKEYEKYEQGLTGRRSLIQGSIGELIETALLNLKSEEAKVGYTIDTQVIGQMSNLLDQEGHGDIQIKIKSGEQIVAVVNIQAKQYNSKTMGQSVYFYKENSYNIFSDTFIRYIGNRDNITNEEDAKQNFLNQIGNNDTIKYLREYSLIADESGSDISAKLYPYFSRFSRIEDICERLDISAEELSMNNFISFNFGLVPMSYILHNIILDLAKEISTKQKSQLFTLYPVDVDGDDFNKVYNISANNNNKDNLLNISYKLENSTTTKNMVSLLEFSGLHVSINDWIRGN